MDENRNNWYKEVEIVKSVIKYGVIVFVFFWNLLNDMVEIFNYNGDILVKWLRYDKYVVYVQYFNDFVIFMKNNGVNFYVIFM